MKATGVLEKGFQMAQVYGYMTREMSHFICGVFIQLVMFLYITNTFACSIPSSNSKWYMLK